MRGIRFETLINKTDHANFGRICWSWYLSPWRQAELDDGVLETRIHSIIVIQGTMVGFVVHLTKDSSILLISYTI